MGKFTEFSLPLKTLQEGVHEFDFTLTKPFFTNMECDEVHGADVKAHVTVTVRHDLYDIVMQVTGELTLLCDRCLDELPWPIEADYHITVKYGDEYCDESDDLLVIPHSDTTLNIAYMLKDTVMLSIPMKHVHPLGKCNRAMTAVLRKHRAAPAQDAAEAELEDELIDEMDSMDTTQPIDNN